MKHDVKPVCLLMLLLIGWWPINAQPVTNTNLFAGFEHLFTTPKNYKVHYTNTAPRVDGQIDEAAWLAAPWTEDFVDIEGDKKAKPLYNTRVKMLWNDSCLFIAAQMEEPHLWASLKQHDTIVYYDNDFEVFIDPNNDTHQYFEIEVNAFNTILDLFMPKPYRNGGAAMIAYNTSGLQSAVQVNGTINKPHDKDKGWMVEMAIPFKSIYIGNHWRAPAEGALWRINFSRVQWETEILNNSYTKKRDKHGKTLPENNWVWSPQGVINMHFPERWGYVLFTKKVEGDVTFALPPDEKKKQYLWLLYYKQKAFRGKHQRYAATLQELGLPTQLRVEDKMQNFSMEATTSQFRGTIRDEQTSISINEEGFIQTTKKPL